MEIRNAEPKDCADIAKIIAYAYADDFRQLTKRLDKIAEIFEDAVIPDCFFVGEVDGKIVAVTAISDKRAAKFDRKLLRKKLGIIKGAIFGMVAKHELENQITTDSETGNIEYVAVEEASRGNGYAKILLEHIIKAVPYKRITLDVKCNNIPAVKTYERLGFKEYKRKKVRARTHGCADIIYMELKK